MQMWSSIARGEEATTRAACVLLLRTPQPGNVVCRYYLGNEGHYVSVDQQGL